MIQNAVCARGPEASPPGAVRVSCDRLSRLRDNMGQSLSVISDSLDRLHGQRPASQENCKPTQPSGPGELTELSERIDSLDRLAQFAAELADRSRLT